MSAYARYIDRERRVSNVELHAFLLAAQLSFVSISVFATVDWQQKGRLACKNLFIYTKSFSLKHCKLLYIVVVVEYLELCPQSVTWKRYSDFKKLHKSMFSLHKALHRREQFPPFVKAQLFSE